VTHETRLALVTAFAHALRDHAADLPGECPELATSAASILLAIVNDTEIRTYGAISKHQDFRAFVGCIRGIQRTKGQAGSNLDTSGIRGASDT
jgi:hypothetical protein